jgi:subtilisin family serine protease
MPASKQNDGGKENSNTQAQKKKKFPWAILIDAVTKIVLAILGNKKDKDKTRSLTFSIQQELDNIPITLPPFKADPIPRSVAIQGETFPYHLHQLGVVEKWNIDTTATGKGIKIGIVDTGVDIDHEDLPQIKGGVSFVSNEPTYDDGHGHGTWCAGDVVAIKGNAKGVAGVAYEADLYAIKVLSASGSGSMLGVVKAIDWAIDNGIDILSMSLGSRIGHSEVEKAVKRATAAGMLIVAAAGNDSDDDISYPAAYPDVIAVGSLSKDDKRSYFSNTGIGLDVTSYGQSIFGLWKDNGYVAISGTSMATPNVAGLLAAYMSKHGKLNPAQAMALIEKWAVDLGDKGYDLTFGHGKLTAKFWEDEEDPEPPKPEPPTPGKGRITKNWPYLVVGALALVIAMLLIFVA